MLKNSANPPVGNPCERSPSNRAANAWPRTVHARASRECVQLTFGRRLSIVRRTRAVMELTAARGWKGVCANSFQFGEFSSANYSRMACNIYNNSNASPFGRPQRPALWCIILGRFIKIVFMCVCLCFTIYMQRSESRALVHPCEIRPMGLSRKPQMVYGKHTGTYSIFVCGIPMHSWRAYSRSCSYSCVHNNNSDCLRT